MNILKIAAIVIPIIYVGIILFLNNSTPIDKIHTNPASAILTRPLEQEEVEFDENYIYYRCTTFSAKYQLISYYGQFTEVDKEEFDKTIGKDSKSESDGKFEYYLGLKKKPIILSNNHNGFISILNHKINQTNITYYVFDSSFQKDIIQEIFLENSGKNDICVCIMIDDFNLESIRCTECYAHSNKDSINIRANELLYNNDISYFEENFEYISEQLEKINNKILPKITADYKSTSLFAGVLYILVLVRLRKNK